MPLYGKKKSYNKYRKREYYLTNTQKRIYANEMKELEESSNMVFLGVMFSISI